MDFYIIISMKPQSVELVQLPVNTAVVIIHSLSSFTARLEDGRIRTWMSEVRQRALENNSRKEILLFSSFY